jgi:hypothetical protein
MPIDSITTGPTLMNQFLKIRRVILRTLAAGFVVSVMVAGAAGAAAPAPPVDEAELLGLGFKVLVATTTAQQDWVRRMAPGQIRAMQRTGKKYFLYPDASRNQVYVGGPKEYDAYRQLYPQSKLAGQAGAKTASEYRAKQDAAMKKSTARDVSDPYYWTNTAVWIPTWGDLGW